MDSTSPPTQDGRATLRPAVFRSTGQEVAVVAVCTLSVGIGSMGAGIVQVTSESIGVALNASVAGITWITAAYTLTCGSFLLFFGAVSDMCGRKKVMVSALATFALLNLLAANARNIIWLDAVRGAQGLCCAAAIPAAVGILGAAYDTPSPRKNKAFAAFSAGNPLGYTISSIASGIGAEYLSWRAGFYLLAIVYGLCVPVAMYVLPADPPLQGSLRQKLRTLDWMGALLITAGMAGFSAALTLASDAPQGWRTPYILVLLLLGSFLMAAFIWWESRVTGPLLPLHFFKSRTFSLLLLAYGAGFLSFSTGSYWLTLLLQALRRTPPVLIAAYLVPQAVAGILVNVWAAFYMHRVDNRLVLCMGVAGYVGASVIWSFQSATSSYWAFVFPGLILSVVGADASYCVVNMYIIGQMPTSQQSLGGSIFNALSQLSVTIGLGISTALFNLEATRTPEGTASLVLGGAWPYRVCFYYGAGQAALAFLLIPLLKLKTQGKAVTKDEVEMPVVPFGAGGMPNSADTDLPSKP